MTGCWSRPAGALLLPGDAAVKRRRDGPRFAVLFVDLDRFKVINDSLGHIAGDRLLIEMARRLELSLRPGDTVARFGGDEFAILLEDISEVSDATRVADRIHKELAAPMRIRGHEVFTNGSIGIVLSTSQYMRPAEILRDADAVVTGCVVHNCPRCGCGLNELPGGELS